MISGVVLMLILPIAMGGIAYLVMRWRGLAGILAASTAALLGVMIVTLPVNEPVQLWGERQIDLSEPVNVLGRELSLGRPDRLALALLLFSAAGIFLLAWRANSQPLLFPIGLGMLSLLSFALLIRPLIYGALFIQIAIALSVLALQPEGEPATRGGLRYLAFSLLALPGILVTHWLLDRYALSPHDTSLLSAAAVLLAISFALLLGIVPFHTWVAAVARDSEPLSSAFVLLVTNGAIWFLLLDFLETYRWLSEHPNFSTVVFSAGLAMVVLGGLIAAAQRRVGSVMGYAALVDSGATLIALSLSNQLGLTLVFLSLLMRPFGMILLGAGLTWLRRRGTDSLDSLRGAVWRTPWATVAMLVGGLSVAGFPVSAGFIWRWALYRALASSSDIGAVGLVLLAGGGIIVGFGRTLSAVLTRTETSDSLPSSAPTRQERWLDTAVIALAVLGCVAVGLFPQVIAPIAGQLAANFTFFGP
ncbi:MAG: hypothetical protein GX601_15950 [Anaerolineales bacterium]|nr:hypothetical protein [Anaerolineales bacterium]